MRRYKVVDAVQGFFKNKETKKTNALPAPPMTRSFRAAYNSRFIQWLFPTSSKVNADLISQLKTLIERSRDLSKNN
ncbi:MAG: hypothetical protein J6S85_26065 [Methanobrevibacter sp.]|nr:hypothetical protein [Methanobrevibacter sp.]MBO7717058.1 hypothetical protein [Methanobrevibacter sp.]